MANTTLNANTTKPATGTSIEYVDIQKRWRQIKPVITSERATRIMRRDMLKYQKGRSSTRVRELPDDYLPWHSDSNDWRFCTGRPGPMPHFWQYVCHSACHWLVNLNLYCARQIMPNEGWQIVSSQGHSTTANRSRTLLWDMNFLALGVTAEEAWDISSNEPDSRIVDGWLTTYVSS